MTVKQHTIVSCTPACFFGVLAGIPLLVSFVLLLIQLHSFFWLMKYYNEGGEDRY